MHLFEFSFNTATALCKHSESLLFDELIQYLVTVPFKRECIVKYLVRFHKTDEDPTEKIKNIVHIIDNNYWVLSRLSERT